MNEEFMLEFTYSPNNLNHVYVNREILISNTDFYLKLDI